MVFDLRANEQARCALHFLQVERQVEPAHPLRVRRRSHRMVQQQIAIAAGDRRVARVEIVRDAPRPDDGADWRQQCIHAAHPRRLRTLRRSIEVHHLVERMHAGVGAPGADRVNGAACHLRKRPFQRVLHGAALGLSLPAAETAAVVLNAQCDSHVLTRPVP